MIKISIFENCGQLGHIEHWNRVFLSMKHNETTHYSLIFPHKQMAVKWYQIINIMNQARTKPPSVHERDIELSRILSNLPEFHK